MMRKWIGAIALASLLAGCQPNADGTTPNIFSDLQAAFGGNQTVSPQQSALREQSDTYADYANARLQAAAAGAVAGALFGALLDQDNPGRGALIGGAVGGTAGYVGATYLTRDHADFTASQEALEEDIAVAEELTASSQRNVEVARAALNYQRTEIERLNAEYAAGLLDREVYEQKLVTISEDRASVQSMIDVTEERVNNMETSIAAYRRAGYGTGRLEAAKEAQKQDIASLEAIEEAMVDLISGVPEDVARPSA